MLSTLDSVYSNITDKPLIINSCITGGVISKKQCKNLPVTPEEIINEAVMLFHEGTTIVHIHVRDEFGNATLDPNIYENVIKGIRSRISDSIICISSSGRFGATIDQRLQLFDLGADMVSLTLGSMNFINGASVTTPDDILAIIDKSRKTATALELEIFDIGMLNYALYLHNKGILFNDEYVNVILGSIGTASVDLVSVGNILDNIPTNWTCSVGGLGKFQLTANMLGIITSNHVRVGLEDNIYYKKRQPTSNLELLNRIKHIAKIYGRDVADRKHTKKMLLS